MTGSGSVTVRYDVSSCRYRVRARLGKPQLTGKIAYGRRKLVTRYQGKSKLVRSDQCDIALLSPGFPQPGDQFPTAVLELRQAFGCTPVRLRSLRVGWVLVASICRE